MLSMRTILRALNEPFPFFRLSGPPCWQTFTPRLKQASAEARAVAALLAKPPSAAALPSAPPVQQAIGAERPIGWQFGDLSAVLKEARARGLGLEEIATRLTAFHRAELGGEPWTEESLTRLLKNSLVGRGTKERHRRKRAEKATEAATAG